MENFQLLSGGKVTVLRSKLLAESNLQLTLLSSSLYIKIIFPNTLALWYDIKTVAFYY